MSLLEKEAAKKRFGHFISLFGDKEELQIPDFEHPGVKIEYKERAAVLFKAIVKLPVNQRTAFTLSKVDELSYKEISDIMKISIPSVESFLFRATANLKKYLECYYSGKI